MNPVHSHSTPIFERPSVAFFGRTLTEYRRFFSLSPDRLRRGSFLDVAAGPASFTAEACALGVAATAVDPLYGRPPEILATHVRLDYAHMFQRMREPGNAARFRLRSFASIDAAEQDRRLAARRFLADYAAHFAHDRYHGAALPRLPFPDRSFDVVLCAHLMFIYPLRFDFAFHLAACRELSRVAREETRIHPVCGPDGLPYADLARLVTALAREGVTAREIPVDYEFFAGARTMLVLTRS